MTPLPLRPFCGLAVLALALTACGPISIVLPALPTLPVTPDATTDSPAPQKRSPEPGASFAPMPGRSYAPDGAYCNNLPAKGFAGMNDKRLGIYATVPLPPSITLIATGEVSVTNMIGAIAGASAASLADFQCHFPMAFAIWRARSHNPVPTPSDHPFPFPSMHPLPPWPSFHPVGQSPEPTEGSPVPSLEPSYHPNVPLPSGYPASLAPSAPGYGPIALVTGTIYDEHGAPVDGAVVRVSSLDPSTPYEATAISTRGQYVVNNVPVNVQIEVHASKDGWTARSRVASYLPGRGPATDFGSLLSDSGNDASGYFISQYPEVALTVVSQNSLILNLSESLDATNQNRFANALRCYALGGAQSALPPVDDFTLTSAAPGFSLDTFKGSAIQNGTILAGDPNSRVSITWNAQNNIATLQFPQGLLQSGVRYEVALAAASDAVLDPQGNPLGTDAAGAWQAKPVPGTLVRGVFAKQDKYLKSTQDTGALRWAATHADATVFTAP